MIFVKSKKLWLGDSCFPYQNYGGGRGCWLMLGLTLIVLGNPSWLRAQTQNYFGTTGTLNANVWSINPAGPYTSALNTTGGAVINFNTATTTITGGNIAITGINATANATITTAGGTISNVSGGNMGINVSSGVTLDLAGQAIGSGAGSITKSGTGTLALSGGSYTGGFTMSAGTVVARAASAFGSGPLTINGGILGATSNLTLSSGSLVIGGNFTFGTSTAPALPAANMTFSGTTNLGTATRTITLGGTGTYSLNGVVSGSGGLTVAATAAGTLALGGTNTYTGKTTVNGGTLAITNVAALGANPASFTADQVTLNGGTLAVNAAITLSGNRGITLGSSGGTVATGTNNVTISSAIAGSGQLTKTGTGVLTLSGSNSYAGGTALTGGSITINSSSGIGTGTVRIGAGAASAGTLFINNTSAVTLSNNIELPAPGTATTYEILKASSGVGTGTLLDLTGVLSGGNANSTLRLNTNVSGENTTTFRLGANNTIAGTIDLNRGTLLITGNNSLGTATLWLNGNGNSTVGDLRFESGVTLANNIVLVGDPTPSPIHTGGHTVTLSGVISSGSSQLIKIGAGTLVLTGNNTYTTATQINTGVLQIGNGGTTGNLGPGSAVNIAATGQLVIDRSNAYTASNGITNAGNVTVNSTGTTTLSGAFSGAGTLTQNGTGTTVLSGNTTYSGATTVNSGTLQLNYTTANSSKLSDSAALNLNGGTVTLVGGNHAESVGSTILGAGTASRVTRSSGTAVINLNAITRNTASTLDFGAAGIARTDNLNNSGGILGRYATINGTDWAVNSTNTADGLITAYSAYTDLTRQSSGTKVIPNTPTANVRITEGTGTPANITLAAATTTITTLNQSASGGTSAATINTGGNTLETSGILAGSGAGGLTVGTSVGSGVLRATGLELILQNHSNGNILVNSIITNNGAGDVTALTTAGAGSTILGANNTYTGATVVNSGSLQVGSGGVGTTGTGAVTVKTGSTILGTGTVRGSTFTAERNSTIRPGDSAASSSHGTLTFTPVSTGSYTMAAGSSTILGVTTATNQTTLDPYFGGNLPGTPGYNAYVNSISGTGAHDKLVFNGSSGSSLTFAGNMQVTGSGFTPQKGQIFNLLDWASVVSTNFSNFNLGTNYRDGSGDNGSQFDLPDISGTGLGWDVSLFTTSGAIVIVPEPSRVLLILLGFFVLIPARGRRKGGT
jgi:autotransporter-associated beta strand protein